MPQSGCFIIQLPRRVLRVYWLGYLPGSVFQEQAPSCVPAFKDAYYSIPISVEDRNFLKFEWQGNYFRFTCLPNGLASAPRLFTKVLKPIYAHLRSLGHFCMGHIDDSFLMGHTYTSCGENIWETTNTFLKLGFVIHPTKSVLIPTQELEFLGFLLNSNSMTIRLPPRKAIIVKVGLQLNFAENLVFRFSLKSATLTI